MKLLRISVLLSAVLLGSLLHADSGRPMAPVEILETKTFVSQAQLKSIDMDNHDCTSPLIPHPDGGYWIHLSEGGKFDGQHSHIRRIRTDLLTADLSTVETVEFRGIPDAGVNDYNGWKAWLLDLYPLGGDEWWALLHFEDQDHGFMETFRLGSAYSRDGGRTFDFLGFTLSPDLAEERVKEGNCTGKINIAGTGMRWDDEYLYVYFSDMSEEDRSDRRIAVARARQEDVAHNARKGRVAEWRKYYDGKWEEPGLGGKSADLGELGEYHTTIAFSEHLDQWLMLSRRGRDVVLLRSDDPMNFHVPEEQFLRLPEEHATAYFTLEEVAGSEPGQAYHVYYRVEHEKVYDVVRTTFAFN